MFERQCLIEVRSNLENPTPTEIVEILAYEGIATTSEVSFKRAGMFVVVLSVFCYVHCMHLIPLVSIAENCQEYNPALLRNG